MVTGTVATETRVLTGDVDWDESVDTDVMFVDGTGVAENVYMTMGTYTVTGTVYHPLSGSVTAICTDTIVIDGEMGAPDTPDCSDILLE